MVFGLSLGPHRPARVLVASLRETRPIVRRATALLCLCTLLPNVAEAQSQAATAQQELVIVPDVTNRPLDTSLALIDKAGLARGRIVNRPSSGPPGIVLDQSLKPGMQVLRGTPLDLAVSIVRNLRVPDVVGRSVEEAEAILGQSGLTVGTITDGSSSRRSGIVVDQSVKPGAPIPAGTSVDLVVSGPSPVTVPAQPVTATDIGTGSPKTGSPPGGRPEPPDTSQFDALKAFIARMQRASGALRAVPAQAEVGEEVDVTLTISPTSSESELRARMREGAVDVGTAKIAARMRAQLIVPVGATMTTVGSEERAVLDTQDTVWRWIVAPTRVGDLQLTARLTAPVVIEGKETPYDIRTFEARVTVFVTPTARAREFVTANWQWLWTALIVPALLWWWRRRATPNGTGRSTRRRR